MEYFIGLIVTISIYGIIIKTVDSGRCFRYEYIIKTIIIMGLYIVCFIVIFIHFSIFSINAFILLFVLGIPVLMYLSLKYTVQRLYDLGFSGWYILLKLIPIFSIAVTIYLYFKKGNYEPNEYEKAINYKKILKNKNIIDIYDKMFFINDNEYQYERYLGKYIIKIPQYEDLNFFTEYLIKHFSIKETQMGKIVEITNDDFENTIKNLNLIILNKSYYLNIKGFKMFIRKENFRYTIILDKKYNEISKELIKTFDFPGSFFEDENYIFYNKIYKDELLMLIK